MQRPLDAALYQPWQLHWRDDRPPPRVLDLLLLDCSASMVQSGALALAKGLGIALMDEAYRARRDVGLIRFGGQHAGVEVWPQQSGWFNGDWVEPLTGGGGTPLQAAVDLAQAVVQQARPAVCCLWLLSDGRVHERPAAPQGCDVIHVLDVDQAPPHRRLPGARLLAEHWQARYLALPAA
ncbi:hypothetical protein CCO03_05310 [Comamonas serinivorans]|uniref:VWFA domain-containing protein n=1 Tax=Comamonas serinivorans TaxID=1082851 RepID=A0A1Y0ELJ2_9BURK|nr:VWA domain-containing protein [Comamonas serinivorans]ARU04172.1 hypothetical protein CCO03_05310 [Comamonas serinivorans]